MNNKWAIFAIGFALFLAYTKFFIDNVAGSSLDACTSMGLYALLQAAYTLYSWKKCTGSYISVYMVFMIAFYLFNVGQVIIDFFGAEYRAHLLLNGYLNQYEYFVAAYFSLGALLFFHFGALLSLGKIRKDTVFASIEEQTQMHKSIYEVGRKFAIFSAPFYIYFVFSKIVVAALYGYNAIYTDKFTHSTIVLLISDFYVPALICMYFASEFLNQKKNKILAIIFLTVLAPPLILGGRANAGIIVAVLLLVYALFHKIKLKQSLVGIFIAFSLMMMFNVIAATRNDVNKSSKSITKSIDGQENPLVSFLAETGFSMYPLGATTSLVPYVRDHEWGATYLWELTTVIPNVGIWDLHPAQTHDPSTWLQEELGHSFGIGYSLIAEAYHNFGFFGFVFMFFNGYIYCLLFSRINRKELNVNPLMVALALMFFWASIKGVRSSFQGVVRGFFYYSLPLYWMMKNVYEKKQRKL